MLTAARGAELTSNDFSCARWVPVLRATPALHTRTPIASLRRVCMLMPSTRAKEEVMFDDRSYADGLLRDLLRLGDSAPRVMHSAGRKIPNSVLLCTDAVMQ